MCFAYGELSGISGPWWYGVGKLYACCQCVESLSDHVKAEQLNLPSSAWYDLNPPCLTFQRVNFCRHLGRREGQNECKRSAYFS
jgi:hypothetical protein